MDAASSGGRPDAYAALSADGHRLRWTRSEPGPDGDVATGEPQRDEVFTITWENEAWTASGTVGFAAVQYVIRISPTWHVRQVLLFRDLEDPDLWLGTDGNGRWGEVNGGHRPELDGCVDVDLACTPFTNTLPIRRLPLHVGHSAEITVATIDVETLDVQRAHQRYTRLTTHRWRLDDLGSGSSSEFDVDRYGLVVDHPGRFHRVVQG